MEAKMHRLRQCELELADFFENSVVAMHWVGSDGMILRANRAELALLGYDREEFVGRHIAEFHVDNEVIQDILRRLQLGEALRDYEARLRCKDGTVKHVLIDSNVKWEDDEFVHTRCFTRDISDRKRVEEELRQARRELESKVETVTEKEAAANERFRLAAKAVRSLIYDLDMATRIVEKSDGLFDLLGYYPAETEPTFEWWQTRLHPHDLPQALRIIEEAIADPDQQHYAAEYRIRHRNGNYVHAWDQAFIVRDAQGRAVRIVGNVLDLTDTKRAKARLTAEHDIVAILAGAASFKTAIPQVLASICLNLDFELGECWLVDNEAGTIACGEIWSRSARETFLAASRRMTFSPGVGLPGRIWSTGSVHWVPDLADDKSFLRREAAIEEGLNSGLGLPIRCGAEVLGVLDFFGYSTEQPDPALLKTLESIGSQIGQFIERAKAQESLRQERAFVRLVLDTDPNPIFVKDAAGRFVLVNKAMASLYGTTPDLLVGRQPEGDMASPRELADYHRVEQEVLQTGRPIALDESNTRPDGTTRWFHTIKVPLTLPGGLTHVLGIASEITDRKRAEEELVIFRALIDQTNDGIEVIDPETGRFLDVNEKACQAHGYTRQEYLSLTVADLDPIIATHSWQEVVGGIRQSGFRIVESQHRRKDGSIFPVEVYVNYVHFNRDYLLAVVRDVTDRKQAEEALRAAQQRLQHTVSSSPSVLYALAIEGESFRHLWTSENIREMMGYTVEDGSGVEWWQTNVHPDDMRRLQEIGLGELFTTGRLVNEYRFRHQDGSYRWIRNEMRLLTDAAGRPYEVVGSWSDIDDWKRLEEQYRQSQKMESIGRLAGGVAHDFNNLLTVINGYSEMLIHQPRLDDATKNLLQEILQAGTRAAGLTQQLLAFSRKQIRQPRLVDLNAALGETKKMLQRMIGEDIELTIRLGVDLGRVIADPSQIDQVIINLAINARDAMPKGGNLVIETDNVVLDKEFTAKRPEVKPGPYVMLMVSDTGSGMDLQTQSRLFEPFFTTKEQGKGTGLGLATVYGVVKQSDGHIDVDSEVGSGTTFKIYLPSVGTLAPSEKSHRGLHTLPQGTETLLLVEDEEGVRRLARHALQKCGYTVIEAEDGRKALEIVAARQDPIHLLVTDVVMPWMSGREVAERLKLMKPAIKVLFLSGYTDDAVVRHGIISAEHHFLQKPFTAADLATKVRQVLDQ